MSSFNLLAVRTGEEPESILYPEPGEQPDSIELNDADGTNPIRFTTTELNLRQLPLGGEAKRIARIKDIKAQVIITDARIAVACSKYDKGGGATAFSVSALPLTVGLNAISKARAKRRRRGKMLVGHVRYPRLLSVGFMERSGLGYPPRLRITTVDPSVETFRGLILDINLPRQLSGRELAEKIAKLSAVYNLAHGDDLSDALRRHLEHLEAPAKLEAIPKGFASYVFVEGPELGVSEALSLSS